MILPGIIIMLTLSYAWLLFFYWRNWKKVPVFSPIETSGHSKITVVIPARNEEKEVGELLYSLQRQSYSPDLFEVIVVDDHSTDGTIAVVKQYPTVKLVSLKDPGLIGKKKAIESGINVSTGEMIVTTDADCIADVKWLETIDSFKQAKGSCFIAAPVRLAHNNSLLQIFQTLDFMVLQGITAAVVHRGSHSMCNGANLAYEKKAFDEVNGFSGIDHIASGDDMLLMHKIKKHSPSRVNYLKSKEAIITSQPMKTWKEFFRQRIRWASKTFYYKDRSLIMVLGLVYLYNLSFLALFVAGFFNYWYWIGLMGAWLIKTIIEWPFVSSVAKFYDNSKLMKYFFFLQPFHIIYTIAAGFLGQFGKYEWKGRRVK